MIACFCCWQDLTIVYDMSTDVDSYAQVRFNLFKYGVVCVVCVVGESSMLSWSTDHIQNQGDYGC